MTSWHKTGAHPFYIGMYIHIYTHIYVHKYTSQKECLHIFSHGCYRAGLEEVSKKTSIFCVRSEQVEPLWIDVIYLFVKSLFFFKKLCGRSTVLEKYMAQSLHSGLY